MKAAHWERGGVGRWRRGNQSGRLELNIPHWLGSGNRVEWPKFSILLTHLLLKPPLFAGGGRKKCRNERKAGETI